MKNKDIKLRAYIKELNKMVYGVGFLNGQVITEDGNSYDGELMLYTGYKDSEDKDIFDQDYVDIIGMIYKVVWGYFEDCCVEGETWVLEGNGYEPTVFYNADQCQVVGNVFENPELIDPEGEGVK